MSSKKPIASKIISLLEKCYPDSSLVLNFSNPLQLLVATILAAQCTDKRVNEVTKGIFKKYKKTEDYGRVKTDELEKDISTISFFRKKAKSINDCCEILVEKHNGSVPPDLRELISLPGVGRKTANIILGNAFGRMAIAVDTHVQRVSTRLGLASSKNPDKIEIELCDVVPENRWTKTCHLFQDHGRKICTAKAPSCLNCILYDLCEWKLKEGEK